jgi:hypothetical protein
MRTNFRMTIPAAGITTPAAPESAVTVEQQVGPWWYWDPDLGQWVYGYQSRYLVDHDPMRGYRMLVRATFLGLRPRFTNPGDETPASLVGELVAEWIIDRSDYLTYERRDDPPGTVWRQAGLGVPLVGLGYPAVAVLAPFDDGDFHLSRTWGDVLDPRATNMENDLRNLQFASRYALGCRIYSRGVTAAPATYGPLQYSGGLAGTLYAMPYTFLRDVGDTGEIVLTLTDDGATVSAGAGCAIASQAEWDWTLANVEIEVQHGAEGALSLFYTSGVKSDAFAHETRLEELHHEDETGRVWASWTPDTDGWIGCVENLGIGEIRATPASFASANGIDAFSVARSTGHLVVAGSHGDGTGDYWNPEEYHSWNGGVWWDFRKQITMTGWTWALYPQQLGPVIAADPLGPLGVASIAAANPKRVVFTRANDANAGLDTATTVTVGEATTVACGLQLVCTPAGVWVLSFTEPRGVAPGLDCTRRYADTLYYLGGEFWAYRPVPLRWGEEWAWRHRVFVSHDGGAEWTESTLPAAWQEYGPYEPIESWSDVGAAANVYVHECEFRPHALVTLWAGQALVLLGYEKPWADWVDPDTSALVQVGYGVWDPIAGEAMARPWGEDLRRVEPFTQTRPGDAMRLQRDPTSGMWYRGDSLLDGGGQRVDPGTRISGCRDCIAHADPTGAVWLMSRDHQGFTWETAEEAPHAFRKESGIGAEVHSHSMACPTRWGGWAVVAHVPGQNLPRFWLALDAPWDLAVVA